MLRIHLLVCTRRCVKFHEFIIFSLRCLTLRWQSLKADLPNSASLDPFCLRRRSQTSGERSDLFDSKSPVFWRLVLWSTLRLSTPHSDSLVQHSFHSTRPRIWSTASLSINTAPPLTNTRVSFDQQCLLWSTQRLLRSITPSDQQCSLWSTQRLLWLALWFFRDLLCLLWSTPRLPWSTPTFPVTGSASFHQHNISLDQHSISFDQHPHLLWSTVAPLVNTASSSINTTSFDWHSDFSD